MITKKSVLRDERTVAIENASYKWALNFLIFALLMDVLYRGLVRHEAAWDLLALDIVGGAICTTYQAYLKTLPHGWGKTAVLIALVGGVIGAIFVGLFLGLMMHGRK